MRGKELGTPRDVGVETEQVVATVSFVDSLISFYLLRALAKASSGPVGSGFGRLGISAGICSRAGE